MASKSIFEGFQTRIVVLQYLAHGFVIFVSTLLSVFVARTLGPTEFGLYATAISAGSVLSVIANFGFKQLVQREVAKPSMVCSTDLTKLTSLAVMSGALILAVGTLIACLIFPKHTNLIFAVGLCFLGISFCELRSSFLRGRSDFSKDATHLVATRSISGLFIVLAYLTMDLTAYAVIFSWAFGLWCWLLITTYPVKLTRPLHPDQRLASALVPILASQLLIVFYFRMDLLVFQLLQSNSMQVGQFSAALRVVEAATFLAMPIRGILLTSLRQSFGEDGPLWRSFVTGCAVALFFGVFLSSILYFLSAPLILFLFGKGYEPAVQYLQVLAFMVAPAYILAIVGEVVVAKEFDTAFSKITLLMTAMTLLSVVLCSVYASLFEIAAVKLIMEFVFALSGMLLCWWFVGKDRDT